MTLNLGMNIKKAIELLNSAKEVIEKQNKIIGDQSKKIKELREDLNSKQIIIEAREELEKTVAEFASYISIYKEVSSDPVKINLPNPLESLQGTYIPLHIPLLKPEDTIIVDTSKHTINKEKVYRSAEDAVKALENGEYDPFEDEEPPLEFKPQNMDLISEQNTLAEATEHKPPKNIDHEYYQGLHDLNDSVNNMNAIVNKVKKPKLSPEVQAILDKHKEK